MIIELLILKIYILDMISDSSTFIGDHDNKTKSNLQFENGIIVTKLKLVIEKLLLHVIVED